MSIRKNNKRNYSKNIIIQSNDKSIDYDSYAKEGMSADYYVLNEANNQLHILFENRVFLDREKNGGCHQWHRYLNGVIYHRVATITNGRAVWSNWHEMKNYSYLTALDARLDAYDRYSNEKNAQFQNAINMVQNATNVMENAISSSLRYSIDRANDAWNRTEDQYNWCLDDICLNNYEFVAIGYPGSVYVTEHPNGVTIKSIARNYTDNIFNRITHGSNAKGTDHTETYLNMEEAKRRLPTMNDIPWQGGHSPLQRSAPRLETDNELNKKYALYTLNACEHSTRIVTGIYNGPDGLFEDDWVFARTLSYKGRRRGWTVAGHG